MGDLLLWNCRSKSTAAELHSVEAAGSARPLPVVGTVSCCGSVDCGTVPLEPGKPTPSESSRVRDSVGYSR